MTQLRTGEVKFQLQKRVRAKRPAVTYLSHCQRHKFPNKISQQMPPPPKKKESSVELQQQT